MPFITPDAAQASTIVSSIKQYRTILDEMRAYDSLIGTGFVTPGRNATSTREATKFFSHWGILWITSFHRLGLINSPADMDDLINSATVKGVDGLYWQREVLGCSDDDYMIFIELCRLGRSYADTYFRE